MRITIKQELYLITEILTRMGVSEEDAAIVAEVTADADLKGFSSHGIGRFPQYIKGLKMGTINPQAEVTVERESPATALLKGNHGFGHVIAYKGMKMAIEKAKNMGIGMVGINNSNHFGIAGYYSD
ncbi:MAG TPA: Ldh family oxidoreductase, partial [Methanobacteriaceae archaeon]|nr:Ldh family oxidoreductase [Methanobacteriaceae archaeon]